MRQTNYRMQDHVIFERLYLLYGLVLKIIAIALQMSIVLSDSHHPQDPSHYHSLNSLFQSPRVQSHPLPQHAHCIPVLYFSKQSVFVGSIFTFVFALSTHQTVLSGRNDVFCPRLPNSLIQDTSSLVLHAAGYNSFKRPRRALFS